MTPAVEVRGLRAAYGAAVVLEGVSFALPPGGLAVLLGPNGAGKSTLLHCLTGLHRPAAGEVRLFGRDPAALPAAERARLVAVVPQELFAPLPFTVGEIVRMGRTASLPRWGRAGAEDRRAADQAMAYMDVLELRDRPFDALSGGERQRVALAMALAREPRLVLLDEPTSHLDINHRFEILQLLDRLHRERGLTVLLTSHDLDLAARFGERLLLLDRGRLEAEGPPRDVLEPDRLRRVYRCDLRVEFDAAGIPVVRPPLPLPGAQGSTRLPVHVIAGGGSGGEALRRLAVAGHPVTCGVLNEGDHDARTAAALGLPCALERPFSPIGAAALGEARRLLDGAAAVVLCDTAFGPGNLANLDLALEARRRGLPVWVHAADIAPRDFTPDGDARGRQAELMAAGARPWSTVDALLQELAKPA